MTVMVRPAIVCAFLVAFLTACGSSPPVRYFALTSTVTKSGQETEDVVVLGVGPIRMAEYLNRPQIVTRGAGSEIVVDEFNRWAEPLSQALHRAVATDIDNSLEGVTVVVFPWEPAVQGQVDYRLLGEVLRFEADNSGRVVLEAQWGIMAVASDEPITRVHRTRYEAQAGTASDPAAVAAAMNEALSSFSADIASRLQSAMQ